MVSCSGAGKNEGEEKRELIFSEDGQRESLTSTGRTYLHRLLCTL